MASQSKKTQTKKPTSKKASVSKRKAAPKKAPRLTWRFYTVTIGIFVIAVTTMIVIALLTASIVAKHTNQARLDRINEIYDSLNIGEDYNMLSSNVFGDKRVYSWDKSRTQSSVIDYLHGDTVSNTLADLDTRIKAAGFTFIDEPYAGSVYVQYHYKSADGEYIRLTVVSKPFEDASLNSVMMNEPNPAALQALDKNVGPAHVTLKVNLDDNNE